MNILSEKAGVVLFELSRLCLSCDGLKEMLTNTFHYGNCSILHL